MEANASERGRQVAQIGVLEERFANVQERLSNVEERLTTVEEVLHRILVNIDAVIEERVQLKLAVLFPKVEELLAHQQRASSTPSKAKRRCPPARVPSHTATASSSKSSPSLNVQDSASTSAVDHAAQPIQPSPSTSKDSPSTSKDSPRSLFEAVMKADVAAVQYFLSIGARVNARDKFGNTALHLAASNGNTNVANVLIAHGGAVDRCGYQQRTPLHLAAANGFSAMVALLLAGGARAEVRDAQGVTPLALAARGGHADVVRYLLDKGATTDTAADDGETPLLTAVKHQRRDVVEMLLKNGASPTTKNPKGESPLFLASAGGYEDILQDLLKHVQHVERDEIARSLRVAGSAKVVWMFAAAARDMVVGQAGKEAFFASVSEGRPEALRGLLQLGVNPNVMNEIGFTGLHVAASRGHNSCVRALLDAGAQVNVLNTSGETPLHLAAMYGKKNCVVALLGGGADPNLRLYNSFVCPSPLDYAKQHNHNDCVLELSARMEQESATKDSSR